MTLVTTMADDDPRSQNDLGNLGRFGFRSISRAFSPVKNVVKKIAKPVAAVTLPVVAMNKKLLQVAGKRPGLITSAGTLLAAAGPIGWGAGAALIAGSAAAEMLARREQPEEAPPEAEPLPNVYAESPSYSSALPFPPSQSEPQLPTYLSPSYPPPPYSSPPPTYYYPSQSGPSFVNQAMSLPSYDSNYSSSTEQDSTAMPGYGYPPSDNKNPYDAAAMQPDSAYEQMNAPYGQYEPGAEWQSVSGIGAIESAPSTLSTPSTIDGRTLAVIIGLGLGTWWLMSRVSTRRSRR